jgi:RNA polymerase sigma factor (sigma-70 family)
LFPDVPASGMPEVDPRLPGALARLSHQQRAAVVLLYVEELSEREAAEAMGISRASVRKHAERGLARLRRAMGVSDAE